MAFDPLSAKPACWALNLLMSKEKSFFFLFCFEALGGVNYSGNFNAAKLDLLLDLKQQKKKLFLNWQGSGFQGH